MRAPSGIAQVRFSSMTDAQRSRCRPRGERGESKQHDCSCPSDSYHAHKPRHACSPTTAMAATVHNAASAPAPTETGEW